MAAVVDVESPKTEADPSSQPEVSVGVLGWLGFVIINFAAWGIISTASWISWIFGFVICLVYTSALIGLAIWLERKGRRYARFVNLLWVLGATFAFVLGLYVSINLIGKIGSTDPADGIDSGDPSLPDLRNNDLARLLPSDASQPLRSWATGSEQSATFAEFGGSLFFNGQVSASRGASGERLWRSSGGAPPTPVTPALRRAQSFVQFGSDLYLVASTDEYGQEVFRIDARNLSAAVVLKDVRSGREGSDARDLFVDTATSTLYFKASFTCPRATCYVWINTIFSSNGTAEGTVDLRGDPCGLAESRCGGGTIPSQSGKPTRAALWGVIFVAALPMMVLAIVVLVRKKMPGLFVNLFGGVICIAAVSYLLANYDDDILSGFPSFMKWFLTIYTSILWTLFAVWSLQKPVVDEWLDELRSWAVAFVGPAFFVIIHIDLEIPWNDDAWRWVVYALVTIIQMLLSTILSRTIPMVAGAIGLFIISWKIAFELVELANIGSGEMKTLTMLALVALQGIGIVVAAIVYAGRREQVDSTVRAFLKCRKS
eukprot:TRINITY_DN2572_c0_g1_i3.p1 TRINITY_DN2572_c0_g1~~TRINITY_DN2572_c0_g1_i3.p1  ORF type:complete len:543 (-),score=64.57 TRINITY_DN2572_c0_g1_i3:402-2030(-)